MENNLQKQKTITIGHELSLLISCHAPSLVNYCTFISLSSSWLSLEQSLSATWQTSPTDDKRQGSGGVLLTSGPLFL